MPSKVYSPWTTTEQISVSSLRNIYTIGKLLEWQNYTVNLSKVGWCQIIYQRGCEASRGQTHMGKMAKCTWNTEVRAWLGRALNEKRRCQPIDRLVLEDEISTADSRLIQSCLQKPLERKLRAAEMEASAATQNHLHVPLTQQGLSTMSW